MRLRAVPLALGPEPELGLEPAVWSDVPEALQDLLVLGIFPWERRAAGTRDRDGRGSLLTADMEFAHESLNCCLSCKTPGWT